MKHFLSNLDLHSETPQDYESIIFGGIALKGTNILFSDEKSLSKSPVPE